jgi:hypothetical protein
MYRLAWICLFLSTLCLADKQCVDQSRCIVMMSGNRGKTKKFCCLKIFFCGIKLIYSLKDSWKACKCDKDCGKSGLVCAIGMKYKQCVCPIYGEREFLFVDASKRDF